MRVYTYSEARQHLASLLERALEEGSVRIQRRDGHSFVVTSESQDSSPLDVEGVDLEVSSEEIVTMIRQARKRA